MDVIEGGIRPEELTRLALIRTSGSDATGYVEFWDNEGTVLPNSDNSTAVAVTISSTARSLAQFVFNAGVNTATTKPGIPDGAAGGCLRISAGSVAWNLGGNLVGGVSSGTGLITNGAPTANSPRQTYSVGDVIFFGKYRAGR